MKSLRVFKRTEKWRLRLSTLEWTCWCIVIIVTVACCYCNALYCGLVFDDISAIKDNRDLRPHTSITNLFKNDFWGTPMNKEQSHKSYRPLCVLTFRWNYAVHELEPMGYHLFNVILHGINSIMYFRLCSLFLPRPPCLIAAILFAVHPIHTEAVTGIVSRAELLSSIFFLSGFFSYLKATKDAGTNWKYLLSTIILAATSMLCKEQGVTLLGVCIVYEIFIVLKLKLHDLPRILEAILYGTTSSCVKESFRRLSLLKMSVALLIIFRFKVMDYQLPTFTKFDNPAAVAPLPIRQMTFNYLLTVNAKLLLFPHNLCCDWTMGTISLVESIFDFRNLQTIALYLIVLKLLHASYVNKKQSKIILVSLTILVLPFIPASNLLFPVGFVVAERTLYTPSMGFCMLVAYGWNSLFKKGRRKCLWFGIICLISIHAVKTIHRNFDWKSDRTLFEAGVKVNQNNAKLYNNLGHALEKEGNFDGALQHFHRASKAQPDDVTAYINMGRLYNNMKMYKEAENTFSKAKDLLPKPRTGESYYTKVAPQHLSVFTNLANLISKNDSRLQEADELYLQVINMRADYTLAYINRGDILIKLNRIKEAQEIYEKALRYDNKNPDIYYNLGVVSWEQGKTPKALEYLNKALEFDPDHKESLMNSAMLIQESGNLELRKTAYERLLKLIDKGYGNHKIYLNMGMLAIDDNDLENAETWLRKAVQVQEDFRSALFNLALLLSHKKKPLEAAPFLHQLLKNHPDHIKGLILLGDIYVNNIRDLDAAEQCYRRILAFDSNHTQGRHNLCVVYVERGDLESAESCFIEAASMAPHVEYIKRHLTTVQTILEEKRMADLTYNEQYHSSKMKQKFSLS